MKSISELVIDTMNDVVQWIQYRGEEFVELFDR